VDDRFDKLKAVSIPGDEEISGLSGQVGRLRASVRQLGISLCAPIAARYLDWDTGEFADIFEDFDKCGMDDDLVTATRTAKF
jgi:hypothetical protein